MSGPCCDITLKASYVPLARRVGVTPDGRDAIVIVTAAASRAAAAKAATDRDLLRRMEVSFVLF